MDAAVQWETTIELLQPLEAAVDAALTKGAISEALRLAYDGVVQAAGIVGRGAVADDGATKVQYVWLELAPLPLDALADGTLADHGTHVTLAYETWDASSAEAAALWRVVADEWGLCEQQRILVSD